jgi:hypothetical protein
MPLFPQSLKKEVDWGDRSSAGDDKSITGEGSSEYRSPIDPVSFSGNFLLGYFSKFLIISMTILLVY